MTETLSTMAAELVANMEPEVVEMCYMDVDFMDRTSFKHITDYGYQALMEDPGHIETVLLQGAERARAEAAPLMDRLRVAAGLGRFV